MSKDADKAKGNSTNVRLRVAQRSQVVWQARCLDELLPQQHKARMIWAVVASLDLSAFCEPIKARQGVCGRDSTDPKILVSLWLYASVRGVGSARELARLCSESKPYEWICGGVSVNHRLLIATLQERQKQSARRMSQMQQQQQHKEPRASTSDGEAMRMKMGDGGYRPALNVQIACDTQSRAIVGVSVTSQGVDYEQSEPMREQVEQRTGRKVEEHLYDGGYVKTEVIERADARRA